MSVEQIAAKSAEWLDGMYDAIANTVDFIMGETLGAMLMPAPETERANPNPQRGNGRQAWVKPNLAHSRRPVVAAK